MKINKKHYLLMCLICGAAFSVSAQMLDLVGGAAIGGAMTKGSISSVNKGMNALKYMQLLQALSQNAQLIRIRHMGRYEQINKSGISGNPFRPYQFNIGNEGASRFYIELSNVESNICKRLVSENIGQVSVVVNGQGSNANACSSTSKIKFIFD